MPNASPCAAPIAAPRLAGLSCFFPAHNEEGNIARVVGDALRVLPSVASVFEIIIVDDGSRDRTGELIDSLARGEPRVRAVHHPRNLGYGAAVKTGLRSGRLDWVFYTDGDGQFVFDEIGRLAARAPHCDAVVGYRVKRQDRVLRRLNGAAWTLLMDLLLRIRVRDVDCAMKLIRRSFLDGMPLKAEGAMISAELLARLRRKGARVAEVPVSHRPRVAGTETGGNPRVILRAFRELIRLYKDLQ